MSLHGKVALVTGAAGGLGSAISRGLAEAGADVVLGVRPGEDAEALAAAIRAAGRSALVVEADVRTAAGADALVDGAVGEHGRLDVLVNNAGTISTSRFLDMPEDEWDRVLETNLRGYFLVGQRAARVMVGQGAGAIVNVSSTRQVQAWPGSAAYCASKGGIAMLTRVMALELAPLGVRVNSIAPGTIPSGLNADYVHDPDFQRERIATIPAGRLGRPEDVVAAVVLLAGDEASFIVGASVAIDGGQTLW